jgi:hypothetical protein
MFVYVQIIQNYCLFVNWKCIFSLIARIWAERLEEWKVGNGRWQRIFDNGLIGFMVEGVQGYLPE